MESQDKEKEYEHNVWGIYRKEWETASPEKKIELNKRMRCWQELMKNGLTASQAYYRAMQEESDKSPIYTLIEEKLDSRVTAKPSGKQLATPSAPRLLKAPLIFLVIALVAAIVYSIVITGDKNTLNTELESVQRTLASTQAELISTRGTLASTKTELNTTKQTLASTQSELKTTEQTLTTTRNELVSTKTELSSTTAKLSSTTAELSSTKQTLVSVQSGLEAAEAQLSLYKDTLGITVYSGVQPPPRGGGLSAEINLINSPAATNPSWKQLVSFLLTDPTDDNIYRENIFVCSEFAQMLHNNAEADGIKAAFVGIDFRGGGVGHALNAFTTTDKGLVYVDCQGSSFIIGRTNEERDKIAYVVKGKEYGLISLGANTPLSYDGYKKMQEDWNYYYQKLEAYNEDVEAFNREIFGRIYYIGTPEWEWIMQWEGNLEAQRDVLDSLLAQLEYVWETLGIVESIEIYW